MSPEQLHVLHARGPLAVATAIWRCAQRKGASFFSVHLQAHPALRPVFQAGWAQYEAQRAGSVYLCRHAQAEGLIKIGCTRRQVGARMRELRTAGVVGDFDLLQAIPHFDAHGLEARLHQHLAPRKVDREWFRVSTDWALVLLDRQAKDDRELRAQLLDS